MAGNGFHNDINNTSFYAVSPRQFDPVITLLRFFFECLDTERRKKSGKIGFQPTRSRAIDTAAMPSIILIDRDFFWFAELTTFSYCLCSGGNIAVGCDEDDV